jgi:hypothetical protein
MLRRLVVFAVALCGAALPLLARAVDGVREINAASTGGVFGPIYTISEPGSYRLTSDLVIPTGRNGILVNNIDNVTLDLNGFAIRGPGGAGTAYGIAVGTSTNVEIRNGTIRDIAGTGILATAAMAIRVIDVRVLAVDDTGINLEAGAGGPLGQHLVRGCTVKDSGGQGVRILGTGGLAEGNLIRDNGSEGLVLVSGSAYGGNVITGNNAGGAQVTGGAPIACNLIGAAAVCP